MAFLVFMMGMFLATSLRAGTHSEASDRAQSGDSATPILRGCSRSFFNDVRYFSISSLDKIFEYLSYAKRAVFESTQKQLSTLESLNKLTANVPRMTDGDLLAWSYSADLIEANGIERFRSALANEINQRRKNNRFYPPTKAITDPRQLRGAQETDWEAVFGGNALFDNAYQSQLADLIKLGMPISQTVNGATGTGTKPWQDWLKNDSSLKSLTDSGLNFLKLSLIEEALMRRLDENSTKIVTQESKPEIQFPELIGFTQKLPFSFTLPPTPTTQEAEKQRLEERRLRCNTDPQKRGDYGRLCGIANFVRRYNHRRNDVPHGLAPPLRKKVENFTDDLKEFWDSALETQGRDSSDARDKRRAHSRDKLMEYLYSANSAEEMERQKDSRPVQSLVEIAHKHGRELTPDEITLLEQMNARSSEDNSFKQLASDFRDIDQINPPNDEGVKDKLRNIPLFSGLLNSKDDPGEKDRAEIFQALKLNPAKDEKSGPTLGFDPTKLSHLAPELFSINDRQKSVEFIKEERPKILKDLWNEMDAAESKTGSPKFPTTGALEDYFDSVLKSDLGKSLSQQLCGVEACDAKTREKPPSPEAINAVKAWLQLQQLQEAYGKDVKSGRGVLPRTHTMNLENDSFEQRDRVPGEG